MESTPISLKAICKFHKIMYICCTCNELTYNVVSVNIKIINKDFELN